MTEEELRRIIREEIRNYYKLQSITENVPAWQGILIPVGVYEFGPDIPAGRYTLCDVDGEPDPSIKLGRLFEDGSVYDYYFNDIIDELEANLTCIEGTFMEVSFGPVVFKPCILRFRKAIEAAYE